MLETASVMPEPLPDCYMTLNNVGLVYPSHDSGALNNQRGKIHTGVGCLKWQGHLNIVHHAISLGVNFK